MIGPIPPGFRFYKALIAEIAVGYLLPPPLVAALVWQESAFQTNAFRFEPDFWNRYLKANGKYRHLNPHRVSSSYGLAQVMYCRVHEDKLTDNDALPPEHLFVPEHGLRTGCQLLRELIDWAGQQTDDPGVVTLAALAAYNGGRGGNNPKSNWPLRNAKYAREVLDRVPVMEKAYGAG